jgi:hypothetical protein
VPERQIEASVVLADPRWGELNHNIIPQPDEC